MTEYILDSGVHWHVPAPLSENSCEVLRSLQAGKSYKEYDRVYIGCSDIASLVLAGNKRNEGLKLHDLNLGIDGSYRAYIVDDKAIIGEQYHLEAEFNTWLKIYDDNGLVKDFKADTIRVYRIGMHCIIQLLDKE